MLAELGMEDSPSYSFSCDIIHQFENYEKVRRFLIIIIIK
jgi:hypothetical protein